MMNTPPANPEMVKFSKIPKWVIPAVKAVIGVLLVLAIAYTLYKAYGQIQANAAEFDLKYVKWRWLALSGGIYAVALLFPATYWYVVLRHLWQTPTYFRTISAHIIGHIGKYVPGKVMVLVMRTGMLKGKGAEATPTVISIFLEGFMQMATGAFLVVCVFLWWAFTSADTQWLFYIAPLLVVCLLPFFPPVFKRILNLLLAKKFHDHLDCLDRFRFSTILAGIPLMVGYWLLLALSYWAVLQGLTLEASLVEFPRYLATIATGMVAGFVVALAPGGLGVREFFTIPLMAPFLEQSVPGAGVAAAVVAAVVLRLVWLATELVFSGGLYLVRKIRKMQQKGT